MEGQVGSTRKGTKKGILKVSMDPNTIEVS